MSKNIALIGTKLGMSSFFEGNEMVPVTLVSVMPNVLFGKYSSKSNNKVVIAGGASVKDKKVPKPQLSNIKKLGLTPKQFVKEFTVKNLDPDKLTVGTEFAVGDYLIGSYVDVRGVSIGKGFQGGIKRWGFAGLNASHGVSLTHRSIGSTGNRSLPGRVFKGKKMPGHMGARNVCVQNVKVVFVDTENNCIGLRGSIPGHVGAQLFMRDAVKKSFSGAVSTLNGVVI